ncbi:MAG: DUF2461 domain-containing protein [Sphingobacteriia bacterium]|nr:DUF2461 domain-containing protein [Sphingobacteriia bacterium]
MMQEIFDFLTALRNNNNREWFNANKEWYAEAKRLHEIFVAKIIKEVAVFDSDVALLSPSDCTFRIYRDVRFRKDKSPYKTNMGAYLSRGGKKSNYGGYYLHLEPGASFLGGGMWMPPAEILKLIRLEIYNFPDEFKQIIQNSDFISIYGPLTGEKLKSYPKDFPSDFPEIELLKHKSYAVTSPLSDKMILSEHIPYVVVKSFQTLLPLVKFINRAIDEAQPG